MPNNEEEGRGRQITLRLLLCTEEPLLALGLGHVLAAEKHYKLNCTGGCQTLPLESLADRRPDILILDCDTSVSLSQLIQIRRRAPECKLVLWVRAISTELAFQAIENGVRAIVRSTTAPHEVLHCLRTVCSGRLWFDEPLKASVGRISSYNLTKREAQLVELLSQGMKNREIASLLSLSQGTVKVYLSKLFRRLSVKDRFELSLFGLRNMSQGDPQPAAARRVKSETGNGPLANAPCLRSLALPFRSLNCSIPSTQHRNVHRSV